MLVQKRFGRKVPLPSKMEIKRDLILMGKADMLVEDFNKGGGSKEDINDLIMRLVDEHHISSDRAQMLINRCDRGRAAPANASEDMGGL
ncbi:hypothetical protein [Methylobacterium sp. CM6257]